MGVLRWLVVVAVESKPRFGLRLRLLDLEATLTPPGQSLTDGSSPSSLSLSLILSVKLSRSTVLWSSRSRLHRRKRDPEAVEKTLKAMEGGGRKGL